MLLLERRHTATRLGNHCAEVGSSLCFGSLAILEFDLDETRRLSHTVEGEQQAGENRNAGEEES